MLAPKRHPPWLLRRTDQVAVAVLVVAALAAIGVWWASHGGWRGELIEIDQADARTAQFQVDINTADWPELMQLPDIGPALARRIIESRETAGPFANNDDLRRVRGIGPKKLEQICPYLSPKPSAVPVQ